MLSSAPAPAPGPRARRRMTGSRESNCFDFLRLAAAAFVLLSHGPHLWDLRHDAFAGVTGLCSLGTLGVTMFFAISGYWVSASWQNARGPGQFAANRALRILPALAACVAACVLVLGPAFTTLPLARYLREPETWGYFHNAWLSLRWALPGVFEANVFPKAVNGSLWTLPIEVTAYAGLAALGALRLLRWPVAVALAALLAVVQWRATGDPAWATLALPPWNVLPVAEAARLGIAFLVGMAVRTAGERALTWWAVPPILAAFWAVRHTPEAAVVASAGFAYLTLLAGRTSPPVLRDAGRFGDFSYGLYLYAWPVQQSLALVFRDRLDLVGYQLACLAVAFALAVASWHAVEKPFLRLKRRTLHAPAG